MVCAIKILFNNEMSNQFRFKSIKVLAIQFKYLGDAVILTPALKALATQIPNIKLHVLVAAEVSPLLESIPWITKVWAMPRERGKAKLLHSLPFIQALRREKFDQSVDFGGNDRGALLSYLSGAKERLGSIEHSYSNFLQKICYTQIVRPVNPGAPYFDLHFELLQALHIKRPKKLKLEIVSNILDVDKTSTFPTKNFILCHISTSQSKKDWPLLHWQTLYHLAHDVGLRLVFSAGPNEREKKLINELKLLIPEAEILPANGDLKLFLSVIKSSQILVSGDTGPLHFAEGLGVPVLGIFGVGNSVRQVAPIYSSANNIICAKACACDTILNDADTCKSSDSCMASVRPEVVFLKLKSMLNFRN